MSAVSRPFPDPSEPTNWQEMWTAQRALLHDTRRHHERLLELISALEEPASLEAIVLTAASPVVESNARLKPTLSVGLLNPAGSPGQVQFSVVGSANAADAIPVPAGKLIVLPVSAGIIEVGTNVALGQGSLYCFLLRFSTLQPAYLGG